MKAKASNGYSQELSRLFAAFLGLLALMLAIRFKILKHPPLLRFYPILIYQDVMVIALLAWTFYGLFRLFVRRRSRQLVFVLGWLLCFVLSLYTAVSGILYTVIHEPLTYGLWIAGDQLAGAEASFQTSLTVSNFVLVAKGLLIFIGVAELLWRGCPRLVVWTETKFYSTVSVCALCLYFLGAHLWALCYVRYLPAIANPELAFISSLFTSDGPTVTDHIPKAYFSDFTTGTKQQGPIASSVRPAFYSTDHDGTVWHPRNVLLIIMESVGSRRLQLYNAPYADNPQMERLARHGLLFNRIYVAQAYTSAAMAALFCSLYPQFGWRPVTRTAPDIKVLGLADVLVKRGYRTAFLHSGALAFDKEGEFLRDHGFQSVIGKKDDALGPADGELLPEATNWLKANSGHPFFLALWTQDTHHPYFSATSHNYMVGNADLNRYLNAIHSTDALIGDLAVVLEKMKLSDDTLIVITGDHGEAFGEHGQTAHNWTVYDEETRIPLLLVNPKLFPQRARQDHLGRQIDIAPTILDLLGYGAPAAWQGESLLSSPGPRRAYLFSRYGNYILGLVDGKFKYVYDFNRKRQELYDLQADPGERQDLSSDSFRQPMMNEDRLRLEAWMIFQNDYLAKLERRSDVGGRGLGSSATSGPGRGWTPSTTILSPDL